MQILRHNRFPQELWIHRYGEVAYEVCVLFLARECADDVI